MLLASPKVFLFLLLPIAQFLKYNVLRKFHLSTLTMSPLIIGKSLYSSIQVSWAKITLSSKIFGLDGVLRLPAVWI